MICVFACVRRRRASCRRSRYRMWMCSAGGELPMSTTGVVFFQRGSRVMVRKWMGIALLLAWTLALSGCQSFRDCMQALGGGCH